MSVLEVEALTLHHGQLQALTDFSMTLEEGRTIVVIGANGAGKSTLLAGLAGQLEPTAGSVLLDGADLTGLAAHRRVAAGISLVPEGRRLFSSLTVEENLLTGQYTGRRGGWDLERVYEKFEWMRERRTQRANQLSGGEQQAVAIGRAMLANPRVLMIDELSLGLAPGVIKRIYRIIPEIVASGTSVILVEQDISQAMRVADRFVCLLEGRTVLAGSPGDFTRAEIEDAYFGAKQGGH